MQLRIVSDLWSYYGRAWVYVLAVFIIWGAAFILFRPYPGGPDEQMHVGYMLAQERENRLWPDLEHFKTYTLGEQAQFDLNYLNHPPY